jgi:DnaJ-class molecular chaperone
MAFKDYYRILGIKPDASNKNIKDAYRRKASESHPDKHPEGEVNPRLFQDISEAYETLVKPVSRKEYDRRYNDHYQRDFSDYEPKGSVKRDFNEPHDPDRYVENLFREFFARPNKKGSRKNYGNHPDNIHYDDLLKGPDDW